MKLETQHWAKPIPLRHFDWEAFDADQMSGICADPECGCRRHLVRGNGASEEEAVLSFVRNLLETHDISVTELMW